MIKSNIASMTRALVSGFFLFCILATSFSTNAADATRHVPTIDELLTLKAIGGAQILALAMESAPVERRGRAMASFSVAFPLSNGVGALFNGFVVDLAGFMWMYLTAALLCAAGIGLTWRHWESLKPSKLR